MKNERSERFYDRLAQGFGLLLLLGLTAAFILAFRAGLLPDQEEGDVFGTVYVMGQTSDEDVSNS